MISNFILAFLEGFALILSPCILPILPILLSGGVTGGHKRPMGIIVGFVLFFAIFTFFSRLLVQHLGLNLDVVRTVAFVMIGLFGVVLVSDYLSGKFNQWTAGIANVGNELSAKQQSGGFLSGILLGSLTSLIWVPCGGPILAAAIVQGAIQKTGLGTFLVFAFFALGSVLPMILISLFGRVILGQAGFLKTRAELLRKIFGVIIILSALFSLFFNVGSLAGSSSPAPASSHVSQSASSTGLVNGIEFPYAAPAFNDPADAWINSAPLTMAQLKGKVVLIDFWTYSCINCVRTLPYIKNWYAKYHQDGLVIIGVHAPEFQFEQSMANVKNAVMKDGITYPVVLDNGYGTWTNYKNNYWPAHYLIDRQGRVVYEHFGEGDYDITENNIRYLLGLSQAAAGANTAASDDSADTTPETYLGYERANAFDSVESIVRDQAATYHYSQNLPVNDFALQGAWTVGAQAITTMSATSELKIHFNARNVYMVAGSANGQPIAVKVLLNGHPNSVLTLQGQTLYRVVSLPKMASGVLTLQPQASGAQFYTFTF